MVQYAAVVHSAARQQPWLRVWLLVLTFGPATALPGAIRRALAEVDPNQPVSDFASGATLAADSIAVRASARCDCRCLPGWRCCWPRPARSPASSPPAAPRA
jgi:hypothetical protein